MNELNQGAERALVAAASMQKAAARAIEAVEAAIGASIAKSRPLHEVLHRLHAETRDLSPKLETMADTVIRACHEHIDGGRASDAAALLANNFKRLDNCLAAAADGNDEALAALKQLGPNGAFDLRIAINAYETAAANIARAMERAA